MRKSLEMERLLFNFAALADLGVEVTSDKDFKGIVKSALYLVMGTLSVSKGVIFQFDYSSREFTIIASKGLEAVNDVKFELAEGEVDELVKTDSILQRTSRQGCVEKFFSREKDNLDRIKASIIVPLIVKGALVGLLTFGRKFSGNDYAKDDFDILSIMARHIAVSLHNHHLLLKLAHKINENKRLYDDLSLIYYDTIQAFATAIDAKDSYTKGHSSRVSQYCVAIAEEMGLSKEGIEGIRIAGFLHDIGKIAVDKNIINKPTSLTKDEKQEINKHPVISYEILSRVRFPWSDISTNVLYHHENMDGSGYPDRLKGGEIPVGARIMALADAFDAMTTDRPYRKKRTLEGTIKEVERSLGRQFDPEIGRCLFKAIKKDIDDGGKRLAVVADLGRNKSVKKINKLLEKMV